MDKEINKTLDAIFDQLSDAAAQASARHDKWIAIDCACQHAEVLTAHDYGRVLAKILALVERFPALDFGGPGPFGSFIETRPVGDYSAALVGSLQRQPSVQVLGWLDRTMRMKPARRRADGGIEQGAYAEVLAGVLSHPQASDDCKEFARMCQQG